jgi:hypothetical protein
MAAVPIPQRPTAKDDTIMYGAGYALVTVLLLWLDFNHMPTNTGIDMSAHGLGSFVLIVANLILFGCLLQGLGKTMLPEDHSMGTYRTWIAAILGMHIAIISAVLSHWLDETSFAHQLLWVQAFAFPGAYITTRFLGKMINGKEEWLWKLGAYRLVNLMLCLDILNVPANEVTPFPLMGWIISLLTLLLLDIFFLIDSIVHNFEVRRTENSKARTLIIIGIFIGVGMMVAIMVPLELKFHVLEGKHWAYQILIAELGALPGAHLIGGSKWLAKIYAGRKPSLSEYSKISTEESKV